jgi:NADPH-dependent 7-cyano-7-deazaguanine reductase QueF
VNSSAYGVFDFGSKIFKNDLARFIERHLKDREDPAKTAVWHRFTPVVGNRVNRVAVAIERLSTVRWSTCLMSITGPISYQG